MGVNGCMLKDACKNKAKEAQMGAETMFCDTYIQCQKNRKWGVMVMLFRGDHMGKWGVRKGFAVRYICA